MPNSLKHPDAHAPDFVYSANNPYAPHAANNGHAVNSAHDAHVNQNAHINQNTHGSHHSHAFDKAPARPGIPLAPTQNMAALNVHPAHYGGSGPGAHDWYNALAAV